MNNYEEVLFEGGNSPVKVLVSREEETIWLSLNEISLLYGMGKSGISKQIKSVMKTIQLTSNSVVADNSSVVSKNASVVAKMETTAPDGKVYKVTYYTFDIVVLVGHKIGSPITILFQNWCLDVLNKNTETSGGDIIIYNNNGLNLSVNIDPKEETVWLSENQIALLFDTTRQNVNLHINNIIKENELNCDSVSKESLHTASDGKQYSVTFYNLDMILAVGYRIKSDRAVVFRRWVTDKLKQYLFKGYVIDEQRVKVATCDESCREELIMKIQQIKEDLFLKPIKEKLFIQGDFFDSYDYFCELASKAHESLIIIDPYIDAPSLRIASKVQEGVNVIVVRSSSSELSKEAIEKFEKQYFPIEVITNDTFHDRFMIIDEKECYSLGASFNYSGRKTFIVNQIETPEIIASIIDLAIHKENKLDI